jgi:uncharacterized protein (TIGR00725 family)
MPRETFPFPAARTNDPINHTASTHDFIAVLGAAKRFTEGQLHLGYRVGVAVAQAHKAMLTGATTGIPYAAAVGACDHGGFVLGISPATDPREHRERYAKPTDFHHTIIYTGLGNDGRSSLIVRSAGVALFVGGEAGTLQEFTAAWLNGTPVLGVLTGSGGISDEIPRLAASFSTSFGSRIVTGNNPEDLVKTACAALGETPSEADVSSPNVSRKENPILQALAHLRPPAP